jgi:hypothetical protein
MHQYFEGKKVSLNKSIFALKDTQYQKNSRVFRQMKVGAEVWTFKTCLKKKEPKSEEYQLQVRLMVSFLEEHTIKVRTHI